MSGPVFVSRLRAVLRARNLRVSDLQQRLAQRGHRISRGALDRLVSERPVHEVTLQVILPVLEELNVGLDAAFQRVEPAELEARARVRTAAKAAVGDLASKGRIERDRQEQIAAADRELDEVSDLLEAAVRQRAPWLFDRRGRLRRKALAQWLIEQTGGKRLLTKEEVVALTAKSEQAPRPVNAP